MSSISHGRTNWGQFLRLPLETGLPFYVVIRSTQKSSRLQQTQSVLSSHFFKRTWVSIRSRGSIPQPLHLQSRALPTELVPQHPLYEYLLEKKTDSLHVVESLPVSNKCLHTNSVFIGGRVEKWVRRVHCSVLYCLLIFMLESVSTFI